MTCTKCTIDLPDDAFNFDRRMRSGRESVCRDCKNAKRRAQWAESEDVREARVRSVRLSRQRAKASLIEEFGRRCRACGYDAYQGALHFHHVDPRTKLFEVNGGSSRSLAALREEAEKCILLCANCHAEVEGGIRELPASNK